MVLENVDDFFKEIEVGREDEEDNGNENEIFDLFSTEIILDDDITEEFDEHIKNRLIDMYAEVEKSYILDPIWKRIIIQKISTSINRIMDIIIKLGIKNLPPHSLFSLLKISKMNISKKVLDRMENRI